MKKGAIILVAAFLAGAVAAENLDAKAGWVWGRDVNPVTFTPQQLIQRSHELTDAEQDLVFVDEGEWYTWSENEAGTSYEYDWMIFAFHNEHLFAERDVDTFR